ncbi:hypothetical protein VCHA53O464_220056 [Vibrio chagasii]|nr:hypothetical protein VCHA53O464_220056 [Vibrio chagasii]
MNLFSFSLKILSVLLLGVILFISFGALSALGTKLNIKFEANYEGGVEEVLEVKFNKAKGQITYFGYDKYGALYDVRQLNGWFFRWGKYYVFPCMITYSPFMPSYFDIKAYYIKETSLGSYILLNHQRGVHMTNDKGIFSLKGAFTNKIKKHSN